jgi:iron complex transport system substrate-binding protein
MRRPVPPAVPAAFVVSILLMLVLSACGLGGGTSGKSGNGGGGKAKSAKAGKGAKRAFPVTVEHRFGTTTIKQRPKRVVTVGLTDQDTALVLGIVPVGVRQWFGDYPSAAWPWSQPALVEADPAIVGDAASIDLAAVKRLHPSVILAMSPDITSADYRDLSKIAPVVGPALPGPAGSIPWATTTRLAGRALGAQPQAAKAIFAAKHDFIVIHAKHPGFSAHTMVAASRDASGTIRIFGPTDPRARFLAQMGFQTPAWVTAGAGDATSFALDPSAAPTVRSDRITWFATPEQVQAIKADPTVAAMPVTQTGRTTFLSQDAPPIGDALRFDTILAVRYAVDWAIPALAPPPAQPAS